MSDRHSSDNEDSLLGRDQAEQREEKIEVPSMRARRKKHILKNKKKQRSSGHKPSKKQTQKTQIMIEASQVADSIIENMNKAYEEDLALAEKGKEVNKKIIYSRKLEQELRNIYVSQQFLELGGLSTFQTWLRKLPNGRDPSLTIKKKLFQTLLSLNVREDHIAASQELLRIVQKNKRSVTKDIRDLSEAIVNKWGRIAYYDIPQ